MMGENNKFFNKRCYGIAIVKSENSCFNADFTGQPRRLPDQNGTIYATDKALKYAIRKYWVDKNLNVFVWKTFKEKDGDYLPNTLEERYNYMCKIMDKKIPLDLFSECIDTKLFGITFAMKSKKEKENKNLSLTGAVQISYGVNRFDDNTIYSNDILSPYADKEGARSSTIGNESKAKEVFYVYDFVVNPKNSVDHFRNDKEVVNKMSITNDEIDSLKEALKHAVTNLNTSSKIGSENVLTLFITLKENSKSQIPMLKNLVKVKKEDDEAAVVDLSKITEIIDSCDAEKTELFYNKSTIRVDGYKSNELHIISLM